jgi:uncharacterized membrane protein YgcG
VKPKNALQAGLAALVAVLTLTSCGNEPTAAPTPTTSRTTTSTTTTTTTAPATAADGADYASCATRSCEVAVSAPVDIRFGGSVPGALSITGVSPDGVNFDLTLDNGGGGNGTLKPGCSAFSFGGGGGSGSLGGPNTECTEPPPGQPGTVTLQMPAMTNGTAILRIVTG